MRIWRQDGIELLDKVPAGVLIARDGKSTPSTPPGFPHKVEYLETSLNPPTWVLLCDGKRNYEQELAEFLHSKGCHSDHAEGCSWFYWSWNLPCETRQRYLNAARNQMNYCVPHLGSDQEKILCFLKGMPTVY